MVEYRTSITHCTWWNTELASHIVHGGIQK